MARIILASFVCQYWLYGSYLRVWFFLWSGGSLHEWMKRLNYCILWLQTINGWLIMLKESLLWKSLLYGAIFCRLFLRLYLDLWFVCPVIINRLCWVDSMQFLLNCWDLIRLQVLWSLKLFWELIESGLRHFRWLLSLVGVKLSCGWGPQLTWLVCDGWPKRLLVRFVSLYIHLTVFGDSVTKWHRTGCNLLILLWTLLEFLYYD